MSQSDDSWSANANDALVVSLVDPSAAGLKTVATFNPKFTYPIFGDEERIFGYQDLKINLRYNANDMRPNLSVSYAKKFEAVGDTEPADIQELLQEFLPPVAFQKEKDFEAAIRQVPSNWTPPGNLISSYDTKDGIYELWKGSLADLAVKQLVTRLQILVSLLIEAGTPIDVEESDMDRWTVFFLFRKQPVRGETGRFSYMFAGYCTVYRFFLYQPPTPPASPSETTPAAKDDLDLGDGNFDLSALPCRSRISQFVIIPPFQGKGNGPRFYNLIFQDYLKHPQTAELTVEDPNEAFDDLRDLADLTFLRTNPGFKALRLNTDLTLPKDGVVPRNLLAPETSEDVRRSVKIAPRQFARVLEMHLMSTLPDSVRPSISPEKPASEKATKEQQHQYALWKLLVKTRLYRQHRDALAEFELPTRIEKLDETLGSVEFEYVRLLAMLEARRQPATTGDQSAAKRPLDDEGEGAGPSKKARVEDA